MARWLDYSSGKRLKRMPRREPERRTKVRDRRSVTRSGRRTADQNLEEREFRVAQRLEYLRRAGSVINAEYRNATEKARRRK